MVFSLRSGGVPTGAMKWVLRSVITMVVGLASTACQTCPDGDKEGSLFCHGEQATCGPSETMCSDTCTAVQSDKDNCGTCGNVCGDGLVCSAGVCASACSTGLTSCGGSCVDQSNDESNCGGCGATVPAATCDVGETCTAGACGCAAPDLVCGGTCLDPRTSKMYCGATGNCMGANAGVTCTGTDACLGGVCTSNLIYRGSLVADNGVWDFGGVAGLPGANAACAAAFPGTAVCAYDNPNPPYGLVLAAARGETIDAKDTANNPVTSWWIDLNVGGDGRCAPNDTQLPWGYGTADQGHYGRHVTLTPATGAISPIVTGSTTLSPCSTPRNVPCCSTSVAP